MIAAIDLFAGMGGWTLGAERAGVRVKWAANHKRPAVDTHAANHPQVAHACQDLHQAIWADVPRHDLNLSSPACTGHTKARGKEQRHHDDARSTAWAVVSCVEYHRPAGCLVENVVEFLEWDLYPVWRAAFEAMGYSVSPHIIDAADHGVPQNRVRVIFVITRSRSPLVLDLPRRDQVSALSILQTGLPTRSIYEKCERTQARYRRGRAMFGDRFLLPYYSSARTGRSALRPLGTLTTRDRFGVVEGDRIRMLSVDECRIGMGFPDSYQLPACGRLAKHMLGNAVCPQVAEDVVTALLQRL